MPEVFRPGPLTRAIEAVVAAGGSDAREARLVAENLVTANLLGHDSHGIGMIPRYVDALLEGGLAVNQHPRVIVDSGALLSLDGCQGYGQVIGAEATAMAIERARHHGVCIVALARSHHLGRIGQWGEQAVSQGLISISFVNVIARALVAPFGGADARFGTNPVCIAIPVPGAPPFLLDMATSAVAQGKVRVAYNKGEKVSPEWLLDDLGNPTSDPRYGVIEPWGALRAFGLHKGYGLALACELLGGALTGGGTLHGEDKSGRSVWNGMLSILIDPARLDANHLFGPETAEFLESVRASPVAAEFDKVRIAGDPERECRQRREQEGIPVDAATWNEIRSAAGKLEIAPDAIQRLAEGTG
jgi:uncharacterized oxidoreductase